MKTPGNKHTALLGLLAAGPRHPYQIEKTVEAISMREWTDLSMSSIYKLLRELEDGGLVESRIELGSKNLAQKIYSLTEQGREALRQAVAERLRNPAAVKWEVDLGLYFQSAVSRVEALDALRSYREKMAALVQGYGELEKYMRADACPEHSIQVAIRSRFLMQAELEWVTGYILAMEKGEKEAQNEKH